MAQFYVIQQKQACKILGLFYIKPRKLAKVLLIYQILIAIGCDRTSTSLKAYQKMSELTVMMLSVNTRDICLNTNYFNFPIKAYMGLQ
ncbi:MAG: hypothetical protein V7K40_29950 [Nostoc sp.]|uniref:hypothetical protein n=1 Tax=Nostoc sp. TaxID=1180 RepID=UPI002FFAFCFF